MACEMVCRRSFAWGVAGSCPPQLTVKDETHDAAAHMTPSDSKVSLRPVQRRLLAPLVVMILLLVGGYSAALLILEKQHVKRFNREIYKRVDAAWHYGLQEERRLLGLMARNALATPGMRSSLMVSDRQRLLATHRERFERFKSRGVTSYSFHGLGGTNLARLHLPEKYGDLVDRPVLREARRTEFTASGLEVGVLGNLALRVVQPIRVRGVVVGYLELGADLGPLLDRMRDLHGIELVLLRDKSKLVRAHWEEWGSIRGEQAEWNQHAGVVLERSTLDPLPEEIDRLFDGPLRAPTDSVLEVGCPDCVWNVRSLPIPDSAGSTVAELVVLNDVTLRQEALSALFRNTSIWAGVLCVALICLLYYVLERVDRYIRGRQRELLENEEDLRITLDSIADAVVALDSDGRIARVNRAAATIFGKRKNLIGRPAAEALELLDPETLEILDPETLESSDSDLPAPAAEFAANEFRREVILIDPVGRQRVVSLSMAAICEEEGNARGFVGVAHDITARREAETKLEVSERRLREAQSMARLGHWELDLTNDRLVWSEEVFKIFEMARRQFKASYQAFLDLVHPDDRQRVDRAFRESVEDRTPYSLVHRLLLPDRRVKWVHERCATEYDADGKAIRSLGTVQDVTERELGERTLRDQRAQLEQMIEAIPEGMVFANLERQILRVNPAFVRIFGYQPDELIGKSTEVLYADRDEFHRQGRRRFNPDAVAHQEPAEISMRRKSGEVFPAELGGSCVRDSQGNAVGYLALYQDITVEQREQEAREELAERLTLATQAAETGVWDWDIKVDELTWDDQMYRIYGVSRDHESASYEVWRRTVHPDDLERTEHEVQLVVSGAAERLDTQFRIKTEEGGIRTIKALGMVFFDDNGNARRMVGINMDITSQETANNAIRIRDRAFATIGVGIVITDATQPDNPVIYCNRAFERLSGYSRKEILGRNCRVMHRGDCDQPGLIELRSAVREGRDCRALLRNYRKDGTPFWNDLTITPVKDSKGTVTHFIGTQQDVTTRVEAARIEEATRDRVRRQRNAIVSFVTGHESSDDLRNVMNRFAEIAAEALQTQRVGIWVLSDDDNILTCLSLFDARAGRHTQGEKLLAKNFPAYFDAIRSLMCIAANDARSDPRTSEFTDSYLKPNGIASMLDNGIVVNGQLTGVICCEHVGDTREWQADEEAFAGTVGALIAEVFANQEKKRISERLQNSERRLAGIISGAMDAIISFDVSGRIEAVNPAAERLFGYTSDDLIDSDVELLLAKPPGQSAELFLRSFVSSDGMAGTGHEVMGHRREGQTLHIELSISEMEFEGRTTFTGILRDITERKRMEFQQRNQQKLESLGTLAAGIAHEINNPVNGIINYAQLIVDELGDENATGQFAREIITESDRVAGIVADLLSFSRQERQTHNPEDLQTIVARTVSLVNTILRHDHITLEISIPDDLPLVNCRGQQIQQVLMNLITNARDALNERYPGSDDAKIIRIFGRSLENHGRKWIRITVEDFGTGIPEEVRERLFDPFYTTKDRTHGTGLGMSISHGIVKEHGGRLHFETETGRHTRFYVDLPVASQDEHEPPMDPEI